MKKYKKIIIVFITLSIIIFYIILPIRKHFLTREEIETGRLMYYSKIGWVDMGHANPVGPKKMVNELEKHLGGTLAYSQDMKKSFLGITVTIRMTNRYSIPKQLGKKRNGILRYVFEDVSKDFEMLQNSYPFKPFCGNGIGDINGDRLALIRALDLKTPSELKKPTPVTEALQKRKSDQESFLLKQYLPNKIPVYKYDSKFVLIWEF